jgi:hypothetical protein
LLRELSKFGQILIEYRMLSGSGGGGHPSSRRSRENRPKGISSRRSNHFSWRSAGVYMGLPECNYGSGEGLAGVASDVCDVLERILFRCCVPQKRGGGGARAARRPAQNENIFKVKLMADFKIYSQKYLSKSWLLGSTLSFCEQRR